MEYNELLENIDKSINDFLDDEFEDEEENKKIEKIEELMNSSSTLIMDDPILKNKFKKEVSLFLKDASDDEAKMELKEVSSNVIKYLENKLKENKENKYVIKCVDKKFFDLDAKEICIHIKNKEKDICEKYLDIPLLFMYSSLGDKDYPASIEISPRLIDFYVNIFGGLFDDILFIPEGLAFYVVSFYIKNYFELDTRFSAYFFASAMCEVLSELNKYARTYYARDKYANELNGEKTKAETYYTIKIKKDFNGDLSIYLNNKQMDMCKEWIELIYKVGKNKYNLSNHYNVMYGSVPNPIVDIKYFKTYMSDKINKINTRIRKTLASVDKSLTKSDIAEIRLLLLPRSIGNIVYNEDKFSFIFDEISN